jgi:hypothetical protein
MFRRALAVYLYIAALAAALLLLLPQATATPPEPPPLPPEPPVAAGICDDVWAVDGFNTRFMVYDVVVDTPRFGPEVKGRQVSEVLDELRQRLCTDDALLVDLTRYVQDGFAAVKSSTRLAQIAKVGTWTLEQRSSAVEQFMSDVMADNPRLTTSNNAYTTWFYRAGASRLDAPGVGVVKASPRRSDFLVWQTKSGSERILRLQCGFQPTAIR